MTALLCCNEITVQFGSHKVLDRLSFCVEQGDYLSVIGKNGSGKSTLIRCLLRLSPLTSGSIVTGEGFRRCDIGYLPQQSGIQKDFPATVEEVVRSGCLGHHRFLPFYTKADKAEAEKNMHRLGICNLRRRSYRTLSGGQQQRVLLARALCATQKLLLLDEPVTGLDPEVSAEFYDIIRELNVQDNIAIIMVSHDLVNGLRDARHVLYLDEETQYFAPIEKFRESGLAARLRQEMNRHGHLREVRHDG
jgi:zinc transport system ATP-binding protein